MEPGIGWQILAKRKVLGEFKISQQGHPVFERQLLIVAQ